MLKRSIVSILIAVITKSIETRNVSVITIGGNASGNSKSATRLDGPIQ